MLHKSSASAHSCQIPPDGTWRPVGDLGQEFGAFHRVDHARQLAHATLVAMRVTMHGYFCVLRVAVAVRATDDHGCSFANSSNAVSSCRSQVSRESAACGSSSTMSRSVLTRASPTIERVLPLINTS